MMKSAVDVVDDTPFVLASSASIRFCLLTANTLMILTSSILFLATTLFVLGFSLHGFVVFAGMALSGLFGWWNAKKYFNDEHKYYYVILMIVVLLIVFFSIFFSSLFREYSSDGQTYHSFARTELVSGRNPYYQPSKEETDRIDAFPIAPWVLGSAIYEITGRIDSSRAFNFIFMAAGFLNAYVMFSVIGTAKKSINILLSILLTFNPIAISQSLSFMLDGQVAMVVVILVSQAMLLTRYVDFPLNLTFGSSIIILTNLKLTGFFYAILLGGGLLSWHLLVDRIVPFILRRRQGLRNSNLIDLRKSFSTQDIKWTLILIVALALGVFFFGYTSYVQGILKNQSLLGVVGNDLEGYLRAHPGNIPPNWLHLTPAERFVASLFSESRLNGDTNAEYKMPFSMTREEFDTFYTSDNRVAGLGPFFGGIVVLMFLLLVTIARSGIIRSRFVLDVLFVALLIAVSVIINPLAWQVRYVPQLWMIPVFVIWSILGYHQANFMQRILSWCICVAMIANISVITASYYSQQFYATREINRDLHKMKTSEMVYASTSNRYVIHAYFLEEKINYRHIPKVNLHLKCPSSVIMPYFGNEVLYCVVNK